MTGRIRLDDLTSGDLDALYDRAERADWLLRDAGVYLTLHNQTGRHDVLGADYGCAGCGLAARIAAHLDPGPRPSGGTGPRTGLDASVSAEQAQHAPVPIRARDSHAGAQPIQPATTPEEPTR